MGVDLKSITTTENLRSQFSEVALTPGPSPRGRGEKTTGAACLPSPSGRGAGGEGKTNFIGTYYLK